MKTKSTLEILIENYFTDDESKRRARLWTSKFEQIINHSPTGAEKLFKLYLQQLHNHEIDPLLTINTPFRNTIPVAQQKPIPRDMEMMRRIRSLIRWNSLAMVMKANQTDGDLGGHISTFQSAATLYDVGFSHFWKGGEDHKPGDLIFFQGHCAPGIYARSFLEGRISEEQMNNFRKEAFSDGLSSYPHPQLMPNYWQFPTVSMGLGPISAIYQAKIMKYLESREILDTKDRKVWCFCGDGEMDEPESLGSISMAGREKLDNLIFVINCNLQRLDGPVRGNGKIIQELERVFKGAGWNVIKVVWGRHWDPLFAKDEHGIMQQAMDEVVDGELQNYKAKGGAYVRQNFFGRDPDLLKFVENYSDDDIYKLNRGGHDPYKIYSAYHQAVHENDGKPTVILTLTTKGYGTGTRQADNTTHQTKTLSKENLKVFRDYFDIPIDDKDLDDIPFYRPAEDSPEIQFMKKTRETLGGNLPFRQAISKPLSVADEGVFDKIIESKGRPISTTQAYVRLLTALLRDANIGERLVPIIPDEARTFGMEALFKSHGIYSSVGQRYKPEDDGQLTSYVESKKGKLLEEGINEAGATSAWAALGTSYSVHDEPMIPMYAFYSMFGFQRVMDFIWAAADAQTKGFLLGCTAGRTTLNGEGLQHQDGHSLVLAATVPNCRSYDPGTPAETAVILREGLKKMYQQHEKVFYYLTLYNEAQENHSLTPLQQEHVVKGMYLLRPSEINKKEDNSKVKVKLLSSGSILSQALTAQTTLESLGYSTEVWSVPSFTELRRDAEQVEKDGKGTSFIQKQLGDQSDCLHLAVTDYVRSYPDGIRAWVPGPYIVLGTDGFGRSDTRANLRKYFGIDSESIVLKVQEQLQRKPSQ